MRVKEAKLCCAFAWSPLAENPGLVATGSIAGAMDDDFSADAHLEIRKCDLWDSTEQEMPIVARIPMHDRVHRIDWTNYGGQQGLIAGGLVDGTVCVWSVKHLMDRGIQDAYDKDAVICRLQAHNGAVRACHFNTVQPHFLATGGQDREFKVYSLQDTSKVQEVPSCGKSTATGEITDIRWNTKFGHILGTTTSSGQVTVWDLKARRSALSFSVAHTNAPPATSLAWHPETPTHVAVARDDPMPAVQIWDLKKAVSPLCELQGHTKGILSLAWSAEDPSILVSCGRDGRTVFWNPITGAITGQLPEEDNFVYEARWSPHIPAVISTASFSSAGLSVYSVHDIGSKWLSRPAAASFGFGNRIAFAAHQKLKIVDTPKTLSSTSESEREFREVLAAHPLNTEEAVGWMKSKGWGIIAAATAARNAQSKVPLLEFLDPHARMKDSGSFDGSKDDDESTCQTASALIVSGKLPDVVDVFIAANRFDDAFAAACLHGPETIQKVQSAYFDFKSKRHRFVRYLSAISSAQFDSLAFDEDAPWEECLALLAAYAPASAFSAACNALGDALEQRENYEGAATCYVCSANIDRTVAMWKKLGKHDIPSLVHTVSVLEQLSDHPCTSPAFAGTLAAHAKTLAQEGEFANAAYYAQRASQMGNTEAAEVADRLRFIARDFSAQVAFPFKLEELPDATTIECQMLQTQNVQQNAVPQDDFSFQAPPTETQPAVRQQRQPQAFAKQQPQVAPQVPTHTQPQPRGYPQQQTQPQAFQQPQPQHQPQPHQAFQQPLPPHQPQPPPQQFQQSQPQHQLQTQPKPQLTQPPPPVQSQAPTQPTTHSQRQQFVRPPEPQPAPFQPPTLPSPPAAQQQAMPQPPQWAQPHAQPTRVPPQPPFAADQGRSNVGQMPQAPPKPPPVFTDPHHVPPAQPQHTQNTGATPQPLPQRPNVIAPRAVMPSPKSQPPTAKATAEQAVPFSSVDTSKVTSQNRPIVDIITDRIEKLTDRRRRDAVEKAASILFRGLNENTVPDSVAALLLEWSSAIGTPKAKDTWRRLSDNHWDAIQAFVNIKFL